MADEIRATPYRYAPLGTANELIGGLLGYLRDPRRTQQMQGLAGLLESTGIPKTVERLAYGEPLTNLQQANVPALRPETAEALLTLLPVPSGANKAAMAAGRAGERLAERVVPQIMERGGMPAGLLQDLAQGSRSNVVKDATPASGLFDYRGSHAAPGPDFGAPLHDLTGGGQMYPADVYSPKAAQFYGAGQAYDQKAFNIAQSFKDKPNAMVTIYRAVPKDLSNSEKLATLENQMAAYMKRGTLPKDAENYSSGSKWYDWAYEQREKLRGLPDEPTNQLGINEGDWVTLTKEYAKDHGESALKGQYKILSKKVRAKDLWTNADSIHEFGYHQSE